MQNACYSAVRCHGHFYHPWVFRGRKAPCAFKSLVNLTYHALWDSAQGVYFMIKALLESGSPSTHGCGFGTRHSSRDPGRKKLEWYSGTRTLGPEAGAWLSERPWALSPTRGRIPWSSRITGKGLERLGSFREKQVTERNSQVWAQQDRDCAARQKSDLELTDPEPTWRASKDVCFTEIPAALFLAALYRALASAPYFEWEKWFLQESYCLGSADLHPQHCSGLSKCPSCLLNRNAMILCTDRWGFPCNHNYFQVWTSNQIL